MTKQGHYLLIFFSCVVIGYNSSVLADCSPDSSSGPVMCNCTEEGPDPYSLGIYYTTREISQTAQEACDACAKEISPDANCTLHAVRGY